MIGARYDEDGRYYWIGTLSPDTKPEPGLYIGHVNIYRQYHDIFTDEPKDMPTAPSPYHEFDYRNKCWRIDLNKVWADVRERRNALMSECDWRVLPDAPTPPEKRPLWEAYRAALRDITKQPDPLNIAWPTPPG